MKNVRILTESGIQQIIKSMIKRKDLEKFLNTLITNESLKSYLFLLDNEDDKYTFDMILILLYEELLDIGNIEYLMDTDNFSTEEMREILEQMLILEYNLFQLEDPSNIPSATNFDTKLYVRDMILNVYHSTTSLIAYKDLDNLNDEVERIYDELDLLVPFIDFNILSLLRINSNLSEIEKDINFYSFLFNYNVNNKNFIRKSVALKLSGSNTNGYYEKIIVNNAGETEKVKIHFDNIINLFSYPHYLLALNPDYQDQHDFLIAYRNQLLKRTINYIE